MRLRDQQALLLRQATGRAPLLMTDPSELLKAPRDLLGQRLAVYADGHRARLVEALANDYPGLRRVLGDAAFGSLAVRYERCFPSGTHDLGRVGQRLADFLVADPLLAELPFLADLARLEWALAEAFVALDEEPITWSELTRLGADAVADRPLRLKAGTALLRSVWPVVEIWRLRDRPDSDVDLPVEGRPETVLVHRDGLALRCRRASAAEAVLIESARDGFRLSNLAAEDERAPWLVEAFRALVSAGVFVDIGKCLSRPEFVQAS